jgi:hypothetical protein
MDDSPHSGPPLPAELALLLACSRWPQTGPGRAGILALAAQPLDWPRLLRLAQHHRLVPLVAWNLTAAFGDGLATAPPILDELRTLTSANTYRALSGLSELRRLLHEFEASCIPVRVLKGVPLAKAVFGDISLRATGDIDLLIDPDERNILAADRILRASGYRGLFDLQRLTPRRLAFYIAHWKDIAYRNPETGFEVDLHWRCFRNSKMPGASLCQASASHAVSFGSFQVSTLPPTETLLYLCVHGTLDGWLFLKSLADVAALVRPLSSPEIDALAARAAAAGVLPELTAALLLVQRYFGVVPSSPALLPAADRTVRHILRFAQRNLERHSFLATRESVPPSAMMAFEFGLRRSFAYRRELLLRVLFRARMWQTIPLPDILFPLYPLLSPVEWILFRLRL